MAHEPLMRTPRHPEPRRPGLWLSWSPLLVLGLSVIASVVLISACMAMIAPEADAATRGLPVIAAR